MNPNDTQPIAQPVMNQPMASAATAPVTTGSEKKVGPIVATLIIVLVLIIAALYVFASKINQPAIPTDNNGELTAGTNDQAANDTVQPVTGNSTDVTTMQADLDASTNGLDNSNF